MYYTADVMDFEFLPKGPYNPGYLDKFSRVIFAGDHGSHFTASQLMYLESQCYRKYKKEVELMFYPSYHAHGRADGAGSEDKTSAFSDLMNHFPRYGASGYTAMTNSSNDKRSVAHEFPKINRSAGIFPKKSEMNTYKHKRKWCHVSYEYEQRSRKTEGILRYQFTTGKGGWKWAELKHRPGRRPLCAACSEIEKGLVRHFPDKCTRKDVTAQEPEAYLKVPDFRRINGIQVATNKSKKPAKTYPCKFAKCKETRFRKPHTANRHMKTKHGDWKQLHANLYEENAEADAGKDTTSKTSKKSKERLRAGKAKPKKAKKCKTSKTSKQGQDSSKDQKGIPQHTQIIYMLMEILTTRTKHFVASPGKQHTLNIQKQRALNIS